ncbi:MAG: FliI/YscN family ATPase [Phycisphaerales bacterium]|nr:FliI/YscN family ATPase [Phycisphaerales bacterium]
MNPPAAAPAPLDVFTSACGEVETLLCEEITGRVAAVRGLTVSAAGLPVPIGARCLVRTRRGAGLHAEVVGLQAGQALLSVFGDATGVAPDDPVVCTAGAPRVPVGFDLLGRVIDAQGAPLDGRPAPRLNVRYPLHATPPPALCRRPIDTPLGLGVRSIDALLTTGRGQRLGIFAGTGVGKSVLMGMICRHTQADVNVIALVGERGREVGDFIEHQLGAAGLARSVVVVCTSDEAPALRVRAGLHATAIAEYFRDQGLDVLLMMDSLTRLAMAQRQLGLSAGEPPTTKGYTPSVFALLPRLLERAGRTQRGSITGIYTVLVEGDDIDEPLADAVRGILDGHVWLARSLANRAHYPAVDVLSSISRVAPDVTSPEHQLAAQAVRRVLATWNDIEDLVNIGAYVPGANVDYDVAVRTRDEINAFLVQARDSSAPLDESLSRLLELAGKINATRNAAQSRPAAPQKPPQPRR